MQQQTGRKRGHDLMHESITVSTEAKERTSRAKRLAVVALADIIGEECEFGCIRSDTFTPLFLPSVAEAKAVYDDLKRISWTNLATFGIYRPQAVSGKAIMDNQIATVFNYDLRTEKIEAMAAHIRTESAKQIERIVKFYSSEKLFVASVRIKGTGAVPEIKAAFDTEAECYATVNRALAMIEGTAVEERIDIFITTVQSQDLSTINWIHHPQGAGQRHFINEIKRLMDS